MRLHNYQVVFSSRPGVNAAPEASNFRHESCTYPSDPANGHLLVQNLYLSVDPAQRCQMNETTGAEYLLPWQLDQPIPGLGGVGVVVQSGHPLYIEGDIVMSGTFDWPWKLYFTIKASNVVQVDKKAVGDRLSLPLSCLGLVGLTALYGITDKSKLQLLPADGSVRRTLVVSGAAGACGHLAGQIARLEGADYVVGICGSDAKCRFLTGRVGFDAAINYRTEDVSDRLKQLCPQGIHCYFDNVGGSVSEAVIKHLCVNGAVVLCGQISTYNSDLPYPPPVSEQLQRFITANNISRDRFLVLDHQRKFEDGVLQLTHWLHSGDIKVFETVEDGLEKAGHAFCSMMSGGNIGKQLVKVSELPA